MKKNKFLVPYAEIIKFENEDVITNSDPQIPDNDVSVKDSDYDAIFD